MATQTLACVRSKLFFQTKGFRDQVALVIYSCKLVADTLCLENNFDRTLGKVFVATWWSPREQEQECRRKHLVVPRGWRPGLASIPE